MCLKTSKIDTKPYSFLSLYYLSIIKIIKLFLRKDKEISFFQGFQSSSVCMHVCVCVCVCVCACMHVWGLCVPVGVAVDECMYVCV